MAQTPSTPETDANQRVNELQAKIAMLEQEVAMLTGKLSNRDPKLLEALRQENAVLEKRFSLVKKALFVIIAESSQPRTENEAKLKYEVLRKSAVEYCKKAKIDPEIWKSIAS